jgi:transcriptional regulator with GAF, ATPase, and Fis domain
VIYTTTDGEKFVWFRLGDTLEQIQEEIFAVCLEHAEWNLTRAAKSLGISRRTAGTWARRLFQEKYNE